MKRGIIRDNDGDYATGLVGKPIQEFCKIEGFNIAVIGEKVASHNTGVHTTATMLATQNFVLVDGKQVCQALDPATCLHLASPGSDFVTINDGDTNASLSGVSLTGNFEWDKNL